MKVTAKMLDVLGELAQPDVVAYYMPYMGRFRPNPYYFLSKSFTACTKQIEGLVDRGLAERFDEQPYGAGHKVRITKAGRKFLKDNA